MTANFRKIMGEVPRPLEIAERDGRNEAPIGQERVSPRTQARRVEPLLGLLASGHIPLDEQLAQHLADHVEHGAYGKPK